MRENIKKRLAALEATRQTSAILNKEATDQHAPMEPGTTVPLGLNK